MASPSFTGAPPVPVISYLIDNRRELFEIAIAAHATAVLIVNLTPTPKDDAAAGAAGVMISTAYRALEILAGLVFPLAKR
jgi:hypothetical protein